MDKNLNQYPLVVLAAGQGSRMNLPKGLLDFKGHPWLVEQLKKFKNYGGARAVIVLGEKNEEYFTAIPELRESIDLKPDDWFEFQGLKISTIVNTETHLGQFSSIQIALQRLAKNHNSVFVLPVDVPVPEAKSWQTLIENLKGKTKVCLPVFQERGGHPVLLSKSFTHVLLTLSLEDKDSRLDTQIRLLPPSEVSRVTVNDNLVIRNLNTPEEWAQFLRINA